MVTRYSTEDTRQTATTVASSIAVAVASHDAVIVTATNATMTTTSRLVDRYKWRMTISGLFPSRVNDQMVSDVRIHND